MIVFGVFGVGAFTFGIFVSWHFMSGRKSKQTSNKQFVGTKTIVTAYDTIQQSAHWNVHLCACNPNQEDTEEP